MLECFSCAVRLHMFLFKLNSITLHPVYKAKYSTHYSAHTMCNVQFRLPYTSLFTADFITKTHTLEAVVPLIYTQWFSYCTVWYCTYCSIHYYSWSPHISFWLLLLKNTHQWNHYNGTTVVFLQWCTRKMVKQLKKANTHSLLCCISQGL